MEKIDITQLDVKDAKGLKKLVELVYRMSELKEEKKFNKQGYNDRLGVAREIYLRNNLDSKFLSKLDDFLSENKFELILNEIKS